MSSLSRSWRRHLTLVPCVVFVVTSLLLTILPGQAPDRNSRASLLSSLPWLMGPLSMSLTSSRTASNSQHLWLNEEGNKLVDRLQSAFPYNRYDRSRIPVFIWQTWKYDISDTNFTPALKIAEETWSSLHPTHIHITLRDDQADSMIKSLYASTEEIYEAYSSMPLNVHRADFFRYLILFALGGTYSDIDTRALKPVHQWLEGHDEITPSIAEEEVGIIIGVEADPDRPDWADWYARRLQLCQWTIRSKPGHPLLSNIIAKITQETLRMKKLGLLKSNQFDLTTMEYTGPGVWTDSVFQYLSNPKYFNSNDRHRTDDTIKLGENVSFADLTGLKRPKLLGDVVILPITSFSPGIGHMGAESVYDPLAFVLHTFQGR